MQLSRLPSIPPNLLADPLGIMSQENKDDKPGLKCFSAPEICSKSVCKLFVLLCTISHWLCPWGLPGLWDSVTYFP